jgi:hypothetical protein
MHFIHPFIHLSIQSCIHSFIHPFIHSSNHSFIHPFIHSSTQPFVHSSIHLIHSSIYPFIHSSIHSSIHPFIQSFIQSFIHSFRLNLEASFGCDGSQMFRTAVTPAVHIFQNITWIGGENLNGISYELGSLCKGSVIFCGMRWCREAAQSSYSNFWLLLLWYRSNHEEFLSHDDGGSVWAFGTGLSWYMSTRAYLQTRFSFLSLSETWSPSHVMALVHSRICWPRDVYHPTCSMGEVPRLEVGV